MAVAAAGRARPHRVCGLCGGRRHVGVRTISTRVTRAPLPVAVLLAGRERAWPGMPTGFSGAFFVIWVPPSACGRRVTTTGRPNDRAFLWSRRRVPSPAAARAGGTAARRDSPSSSRTPVLRVPRHRRARLPLVRRDPRVLLPPLRTARCTVGLGLGHACAPRQRAPADAVHVRLQLHPSPCRRPPRLLHLLARRPNASPDVEGRDRPERATTCLGVGQPRRGRPR